MTFVVPKFAMSLVDGGRLGLPCPTDQLVAFSQAVLTEPFQRATPLSKESVQSPARLVRVDCSTQLLVVLLAVWPEEAQLPLLRQSCNVDSALPFNSASS